MSFIITYKMSFIITYKHSGTKRLAKPKLAGIEREACTSLPPFPAQRAVKRQKRARIGSPPRA